MLSSHQYPSSVIACISIYIQVNSYKDSYQRIQHDNKTSAKCISELCFSENTGTWNVHSKHSMTHESVGQHSTQRSQRK